MPQVLLLHIKRFSATKKLTSRVEFRAKLTIPATLNDNNCAEAFKLQSYIVHQGSKNKGHYWTNSLCNGQWMELNDTKITKVRYIIL